MQEKAQGHWVFTRLRRTAIKMKSSNTDKDKKITMTAKKLFISIILSKIMAKARGKILREHRFPETFIRGEIYGRKIIFHKLNLEINGQVL